MRAALVLLVACSSSSAPDKPPAPQGKLFRELNISEADSYCMAASTYRRETGKLPGAAKVRCATDALKAAGSPDNKTAADMKLACQGELASCVTTGPTIPDLDCSTHTFTEQLASCGDLTLEEMTACTEEMRGMMVAVAKEDPCAAAFDPADPGKPYTAYLAKLKGRACAAVSAKCAKP